MKKRFNADEEAGNSDAAVLSWCLCLQKSPILVPNSIIETR